MWEIIFLVCALHSVIGATWMRVLSVKSREKDSAHWLSLAVLHHKWSVLPLRDPFYCLENIASALSSVVLSGWRIRLSVLFRNSDRWECTRIGETLEVARFARVQNTLLGWQMHGSFRLVKWPRKSGRYRYCRMRLYGRCVSLLP